MSEYRKVCRADEIAEGQGKTVSAGGKLIAVFRKDGEFFAVDDTCPHMGASLSGGYVEDGVVTCPWHAWRFSVTDGTWADNPRAGQMLGCYAVRVEGGDVQVQIPESPPGTSKENTP